MDPTEWADDARNAEYQENPKHQRAIDIIESMLLDKESPSVAAKAITTIYEPCIHDSKQHITISGCWGIVCRAARACGCTHADKLADLIIAIQALPDVTDSSGAPIRHEWSGFFWKDLPAWRMMFREYGLDTDEPDDFESAELIYRPQRAPLLNATTFAATLFVRAPFSSWLGFDAVNAMHYALDTDECDDSDHHLAELYLPAAATWILQAGQKLHEAFRNRLDSGNVIKFSPEQWNQWKHRFEAISTDSTYEQENRDWAVRAARQMEVLSVE